MSAAVFPPASVAHPADVTAAPGTHRHQRHHLGLGRLADALHAVRVFAGAAFDVVVLGEYGEEAGIRRT
ncbi:hypothetical protein [Streptomyces mexicanus]|jgi:hypothetical protein|uniref:hypothetical protein n=1 Tax=Streptomyces mexicanus TaxID=178566 RepID=UPI0031EF29B8